MAVLAVLAAVGVVAWTWRHPSAFPEMAPEVSMSTDRWPVGRAIFVGMAHSPAAGEGALTLHRAEANVVTNTADATISLGICRLKPDAGMIGSVRASDLSSFCASWLPVDDHRLASGSGALEQLLMKVTPRQRGNVEIAGAAVTYSDGWQRGTQDIGEHLRLRVR